MRHSKSGLPPSLKQCSYPLIQKTKFLPHPAEIVLCNRRSGTARTRVFSMFQPGDDFLTTSGTACGLPRRFFRECRDQFVPSFPIVLVEILMDNLPGDIRRDLVGRGFLVFCHSLFDSSK